MGWVSLGEIGFIGRKRDQRAPVEMPVTLFFDQFSLPFPCLLSFQDSFRVTENSMC